jgi:serine protease
MGEWKLSAGGVVVQELYQSLNAMPAVEDGLYIELVFADQKMVTDVQSTLAEVLPDVGAIAQSVFGRESDKFIFAHFPAIDPSGQEAAVFSFARGLREAVGAFEANPILMDSLYGAVATGVVTDESLFSICETERTNVRPFGWVHPVIKTPRAWQQTRGSGSTVAVIDTGYSSHNELNGVIQSDGQLNLVEGDHDARDRFSGGFLKHPGHGTLVCSVVASRGNADMEGEVAGPGAVTGAAPAAKVLPIRAIKSVINFSQRRIPAAIDHAILQKVDVIAMALGGATRQGSTEDALRRAVEAGIVIVCAAGNCWPKVVFPAAYAANGLCTAVAALTQDLTPWDKSGRGPEVTLSAPGENVWGAAKNKASDPDNGIRASQGTTLATSLTAGIAALWVAKHGGRTALRAKAHAAGTTVQAMWVHCATHGLVKPAIWNGATNLGAGVIDAEKTLNAPLPLSATGAEAVLSMASRDVGIESNSNLLQLHLANHHPEALNELTPELAPFAGEILWLSHRNGARGRAAEALGTEAQIRPEPVSVELAAALSSKAALKAVAGQF